MNVLHAISKSRIKPDRFLACIEISAGSSCKYELDKESGALVLDRILYTATHYPHNYGFIPHTLAEDNDPIDVLLITSERIVPTTLVRGKPIGMIDMIDQGARDVKILAVCPDDPFFNNYDDISQLPEHIVQEITYFFETYKVLEGKETLVPGLKGKDVALQLIKEAIDRFDAKYGK